jgi:general stress protein 26
MNVSNFEDIQAEFMRRAQQAVYCNVATADLKGRPRSRVMHLVWDGPTGWVITWAESLKAKHLANNPHVSLAYIGNPYKPIYVECTAGWVTEVDEQLRIWELHKSIPAPLGFDPGPGYRTIEDKYFGLLKFTPWRIELAELKAESLIWRPEKT